MQPASHREQTGDRPSGASKPDSAQPDLQNEILCAERPRRFFDADMANLVADRFLAERGSLFRTVAMFIFPQDDSVWQRFAPDQSERLVAARKLACDSIETMERAALTYEQKRKGHTLVNPAELLETVEKEMLQIKEAATIARTANFEIARAFGRISESNPNQLVLVDGAPLTPESLQQASAVREDRTRRIFDGIISWASSFQLGALEEVKPEITNLNGIATGFCAGRTGVVFADGDHHVMVNRDAAEFLIASVCGHFLQSVSRSLGRSVDAILADPKFWRMGDAEFNASGSLRDLKAVTTLAPETIISIEAPSQISVRLDVPEVLRDSMRPEKIWLEHEIKVLERFANSKGVGFETEIAPENGVLEVRFLFARMSPREIPPGKAPDSPILPAEESPVALEIPPFESQLIDFQRINPDPQGRPHSTAITLPAEALLSSRARFTIGEMLSGIDDAVMAFPEISHAILQGASNTPGKSRGDFERAEAVAIITGYRSDPEFNPSVSRFSQLWSNFPWEAEEASSSTGEGPAPVEYVKEVANSDTVTLNAEASLLIWHKDIWQRALKLGTRCTVSYLDLGPLPASIGDEELLHHRAPLMMIESLEPKIDLVRQELKGADFYMTIAALSSGRRYEDHITHSVQFAGEEGVFIRGVYDRTSGFRLHPHSEALVDAAVSQVVEALAVIPDEKRHHATAVITALSNASIRFHDQLVSELVKAVPEVPLTTEQYQALTAMVVQRFFSDPVTSIEIGKDGLYLRFLGDVADRPNGTSRETPPSIESDLKI